ESVQLRLFERDARGQGVATMTHQQITALPQSIGQIKSRDTSAGPSPVRAVPTHDDRWPVKPLKDARGHDTYDAQMPGRLTLDDHQIGFRFESRLQRLDHLF